MLRYTLEQLGKKGELLECDKEVDPVFELGGVLKYFRNRKPILFNRVKNSRIKVAGGLYGDRDIMYYLLHTDNENRISKLAEAIANPQPYKVVDKGPIKENIIRRNIDLPKIFPIPKFQGKDSSEFITAGVLVVKDPETQRYFTSIRRLQINGETRFQSL